MDITLPRGYTYSEISLIPVYSNVASRNTPNIETWITKNRKSSLPFIPANMDSVISEGIASILIEKGGYPILHRFMSGEDQLSFVKKFEDKCFISCGVNNPKELRNITTLLDAGAVGVTIDIAHGHSQVVMDLIKEIKSLRPNKDIIAGNVATPEGYQDLCVAGADAVKVGIAGGKACTTKNVTAAYVPQFTAVRGCKSNSDRFRIPYIADGGIKSSRDCVLALAAGASSVMIGSLFAETYESAGKKYYISSPAEEPLLLPPFDIEDDLWRKAISENGVYSLYRGQASKEFQLDFYGELKPGTVPEGKSMMLKVEKSASDIIEELSGGVRSGMTYGGSTSIKELQRKAQFMVIKELSD